MKIIIILLLLSCVQCMCGVSTLFEPIFNSSCKKKERKSKRLRHETETPSTHEDTNKTKKKPSRGSHNNNKNIKYQPTDQPQFHTGKYAKWSFTFMMVIFARRFVCATRRPSLSCKGLTLSCMDSNITRILKQSSYRFFNLNNRFDSFYRNTASYLLKKLLLKKMVL